MATEENVETIRKQLQCVEFMGMVMACPILERAQTPGIGYRERGVYGGKGGGGPGDTSLSQHELEELLPYRVAHTASTVICAEVRCGETCQYITAAGWVTCLFSTAERCTTCAAITTSTPSPSAAKTGWRTSSSARGLPWRTPPSSTPWPPSTCWSGWDT